MNFLNKIRHYHFEFYHFIILISVLIISQVILSYTNVSSTEDLLATSLEHYRLETAERQAEFTTIALEQVIHQNLLLKNTPQFSRDVLVETLEFIIKQQKLQRNVNDICIVIPYENEVLSLEDGSSVYELIFNNRFIETQSSNTIAVQLFNSNKPSLLFDENIITVSDNKSLFHVLVPFTLKGEVAGAVYLYIQPNISSMAQVISSSFSQTSAIVSLIILLALLIVFLITTYVVKERDNAQAILFAQKEIQIKNSIEAKKEAAFTKRIYHAHHKAEKVVGFIKEDLRNLGNNNLLDMKIKISKYANFIGRVIYDMKTYNPPINVIRNRNFNTNLNHVIRFVVNNIIKRSYKNNEELDIKLILDDLIPDLHVNEYVIWEVFEPLIQNSIEHSKVEQLEINIITKLNIDNGNISCDIFDNGGGIDEYLLKLNSENIQNIFLENSSTHSQNHNRGYGCFIAYENSKKCGWKITAENYLSGAKFKINIS